MVFYGSQTGTGEGFAGRLAKDARRFGMPSMIYDPEDCSDWVSDYVIKAINCIEHDKIFIRRFINRTIYNL